MITEQDFLEALAIVEGYQQQVNDLANIAKRGPQSTALIRDLKLTSRATTALRVSVYKRAIKLQPNRALSPFAVMDNPVPFLEDIGFGLKDLRGCRNCGKKTVLEITDELARHGVILPALKH